VVEHGGVDDGAEVVAQPAPVHAGEAEDGRQCRVVGQDVGQRADGEAGVPARVPRGAGGPGDLLDDGPDVRCEQLQVPVRGGVVVGGGALGVVGERRGEVRPPAPPASGLTARIPLDDWEKGIDLVARGVKVVLEVRPEA
jgi:hypothetical protein